MFLNWGNYEQVFDFAAFVDVNYIIQRRSFYATGIIKDFEYYYNRGFFRAAAETDNVSRGRRSAIH